MNYGAIGFIIGHEITHGFDDMGRQYDFDGNLRDWWQSDTANHFIEKAQCIIDQYGNYTDPATNLMVRISFFLHFICFPNIEFLLFKLSFIERCGVRTKEAIACWKAFYSKN